MRTLTEQLTAYAAFHRDRRNLVTHFIGIPMIVAGVATLLARPVVEAGGVPWSPAIIYSAAVALYYLWLDLRFGVAMAVVLAIAVVIGQWFGAQPTATWLAAGAGLFVLGWAIQFVGHWYEGRKPAFVDDVFGLVVGIGVVFLLAEAAFAFGWRRGLQQAIEAEVGPLGVRGTALERG